ncbi:MAG: NAD(P)-dependent oxidoreductase [Gammaproteobacteria bacterium]
MFLTTSSLRQTSGELKFGEELASVKANRQRFFQEIIAKFKPEYDQKIVFIVVIHALPTSYDFVVALNTIPNAKVAKIILKSSNRDPHTVEKIENQFKNMVITDPTYKKKLRKEAGIAKNLIDETGRPDESVIIFDIGGYFAHRLSELNQCERLIGIVEDTANGEEKYIGRIHDFRKPVISVARCSLKGTEDYNVGKSIVHAAESMLRDSFNIILENVGKTFVIGFGRVGRSIATHLRQKGISVIIHDNDPVKMMEAKSEGYEVSDKEKILNKASMIFCATGNRSFTLQELKRIKKNEVFIASCTSADDEFDLHGMTDKQQIKLDSYTRCSFSPDSTIYLLAHGNAINFHYKAIVGEYIRAVQAGMILAAFTLLDRKAELVGKISKILPWQEELISQIWLKVYEGIMKKPCVKWPVYTDVAPVWKSSRENLRGKLVEVRKKKVFTNSFRVINIFGGNSSDKTTLVSEFGKEHQAFYDLMWWFDFSEDFSFSMKMFAKELGIEVDGQSIDSIQAAVVQYLKNSTNFLLAFDSIDDKGLEDEILKFISKFEIPRGRKHFVVISRKKIEYTFGDDPYRAGWYLSKPMSASLDADEAFDFIKNKLPLNDEFVIKKLAEMLQYNVFNLRMAIIFISKMHNGNINLYSHRVSPSSQNISNLLIDNNLSLCRDNEVKFFEKIIFFNVRAFSRSFLMEFSKYLLIHQPEEVIKRLLDSGLLQGFSFDIDKQAENQKGETLYRIDSLVRKHCLTILSQKNDDLMVFALNAAMFLGKVFNYDFYNPDSKVTEDLLAYIPHIENYLLTIKNCSFNSIVTLASLRVSYNTAVELPNDLKQFENDVLSNSCAIQLLYRLATIYLKEYREYRRSFELYELILKIFNANTALRSKLQEIYEMTKIHLATNANLFMKLGYNLRYTYEDILAFTQAIIEKYKDQEPNYRVIDALITHAYSLKYHACKVDIPAEQRNMEIEAGLDFLKEAQEKIGRLNKNKVSKRIKSSICHALGEFYVQLGNFQDARQPLEAALKIRMALNAESDSPCHLDVARTKQKLAKVLLELYKRDKILNDLIEAQRLCDDAYKTQLYFFIDSHDNLEDTADTKRVILEKITQYELEHKISWDTVAKSHPPSPFRPTAPTTSLHKLHAARKRPRAYSSLDLSDQGLPPADQMEEEDSSDLEGRSASYGGHSMFKNNSSAGASADTSKASISSETRIKYARRTPPPDDPESTSPQHEQSP